MGRWKLWFVLLLTLFICFESKEVWEHVNATNEEPYVYPLCTNETSRIVTFILCRIETERSLGAVCRLGYEYSEGFEGGCGPRFRLETENQTIFLHLTNLTPEDNGWYHCECSQHGETHRLYLNITVTEITHSSTETFFPVIVGAIIFTIITGVLLGCICRWIYCGRRQEPVISHPNTEAEHIEPYSTFIQRDNGLYSIAKVHSSRMNN